MKKILIITAMIIVSIDRTALGQFGYHEHDGFFLRMLYGLGYAELVEKDVLGSDMKFSGLAQNLRFQIGGTVAENLMLYGEFGGVMQFDPEFEWMGQSGTAEDVTVSVFDFGGGITYYLMPSNFYFSLSLLASQAEFEFNGTKGESQYGIGINGMIGKEWWVDAQWALGAAIYVYYSTMNDKGGEENNINNFSVGVLFSVTYN